MLRVDPEPFESPFARLRVLSHSTFAHGPECIDGQRRRTHGPEGNRGEVLLAALFPILRSSTATEDGRAGLASRRRVNGKAHGSRSYGEIYQHLVDPLNDEMHLLRSAVILAGTSHISQSAEVEFRLGEHLSGFKGKDMGLAGDMLLLEGSQKRGWNLHPEESFHSGRNDLAVQEFVNPLEV